MRDNYSPRRLSRDEMIAQRAAGTPIPDGSGRIVRNGVIVSAQDAANSAATRARDAAFARQTGQYADRSGTVNPDSEGRAAFARRIGAAGGGMEGQGSEGGDGSTLSPITRSTLTLKRAYQDLGAIRADTREQKIEIAKDAGLFEPVRRDWNARNKKSGRVMDENGNIAAMNTPAAEKGGSTSPAASPVSRVYAGPAFGTDQEQAANRIRVKSEQTAAQGQTDEDMAAALGITVEELRRRRAARRLGQAAQSVAPVTL